MFHSPKEMLPIRMRALPGTRSGCEITYASVTSQIEMASWIETTSGRFPGTFDRLWTSIEAPER